MLVRDLREFLDQFHDLDPVEGDIGRDEYVGGVVLGKEIEPEFDDDECCLPHLVGASVEALLRELCRGRPTDAPATPDASVAGLTLPDLVGWVCFRFSEWDAAEQEKLAKEKRHLRVVDTKAGL